jgi:probable F420-dependent oxidoreductase
MHPFRFGIQVYTATTAAEWVDKARRAEDLGYATLTMPDHIGNHFAFVPAVMAVAAVTRRLHVGSFVVNNDFRHPALLANEAATADLLTGGRFLLGLGAGWQQAEYDALGLPFDPPATRIARLEESVQLIKRLFDPEPVTFHGRYYQVTDLTGFPRPIQQPRPPILIGGGGRRILTLAAREADIVGLNQRLVGSGQVDLTSMTAAATAEKVAWVRQAAGERLPHLELNLQLHHVVVTDNRQAGVEAVARETGHSVEHVLDTPYALIGSVDAVVEQLQALRERYGISYLNVRERFMETFAPIIARLDGR